MTDEDAPVTGLVPLGPVPKGHPVGAYLVTGVERVGLGFVLDPAMPDGAELCRLWQDAWDELDRAEPGTPLIPRQRGRRFTLLQG